MLDPAAVFLVVRPPAREVKPATRAILPMVTDLLINALGGDACAPAEVERLGGQFPALRPRFEYRVDLVQEELPAGLLTRLRSVLACA
jgi:hypothetical protein